MKFKTLLMVAIVLMAGSAPLWAQRAVEKSLPVDGNIAPNGRAVELSWFEADPPRVGAVTVRRRLHGQTGGDTWKTVLSGAGPVMRFTDEAVKPGVAYEYQVLRSARDIVDVGYWLTGVELPATEKRGNAYVIVDESIAAQIGPRLSRFERDLTGDGWWVRRHSVPRWDNSVSTATLEAAARIKGLLRDHYQADPFGQHVVILVGHVPIVSSGRVSPDGHKVEPHATDLFYVELDARWRANKEGRLLENRLPGSTAEMQIGRIDFANVAGGDRDREVDLLRSYFDKNHHWRLGLTGDYRTAYGASGYLKSEQYNLRNIVGPKAVLSGDGSPVPTTDPWLWAVDFGAKRYDGKAIFAINFGSGKQKIERPSNKMTGFLTRPWYSLAVGWGGRPAWRLHHMALGGSVGDVHLRTVNNGQAERPYRESMDYFPTGEHMWRNPVWVNLLGDPTTRAFPLRAPSALVARRSGDKVSLSWTASDDPDVIGYKLYRAPQGSMRFAPLSGDTPVKGPPYVDGKPLENARYMVRAYGLKDVYAGSFYTLSQGVFADIDGQNSLPDEIVISTAAGTAVMLPEIFNRSAGAELSYAVIEPPEAGQLEAEGSGWRYVPATGYTGEVPLRYSVSDHLQTREGRLTIIVGN